MGIVYECRVDQDEDFLLLGLFLFIDNWQTFRFDQDICIAGPSFDDISDSFFLFLTEEDV